MSHWTAQFGTVLQAFLDFHDIDICEDYRPILTSVLSHLGSGFASMAGISRSDTAAYQDRISGC